MKTTAIGDWHGVFRFAASRPSLSDRIHALIYALSVVKLGNYGSSRFHHHQGF